MKNENKKRASYGRIKETTIGGIFIPREYRHISLYEEEILKLREKSMTHQEIADEFDFTKEQVRDFIKSYNAKQRKLNTGIAIHKKGSPAKDYVVSENDKVIELRYILARKEAKIR